ncbi:MAG: glycosyltransferase family 2 protein, partial [Dehalococcoidia bacterium]|nr:glycosyltransferase family 2 protein [Dehalococcoidia bacterium]
PTYNERDNIVPLVERLHRALAGFDYEVVFVDDSSQDGTVEVISGLADVYPVKVIVRRNERGLASAVLEGIRRTDSPVVGVMDADLQHPPEIMPDLLKALDTGADIAVASRYVRGGGCYGWGLLRRLISRGAVVLAHMFLPSSRRVHDAVSGYFAFRRRGVEGALLDPLGFKILLEILVAGRWSRVVEVPYVFRTRSAGRSKLRLGQQIDYLRHILALMRRTGELLRFLKFCLVGASGVGVNEGLLWLLREFVGLPLPLASAISIESSIISNFTLNDYFTFRDLRVRGLRSFLSRLGKFNLVSLVGLGINMGTLLALTYLLGVHYLVANLAGIALAVMWNYLVNLRWTWK